MGMNRGRGRDAQHEKRTLFGDMVCFLFITPLATISGWLCLRGAVDHLHFSSRLEAVGLIALTVALFTIYLFWTLVSMARSPGIAAGGCWQQPAGMAFLLVCSSSHLPGSTRALSAGDSDSGGVCVCTCMCIAGKGR